MDVDRAAQLRDRAKVGSVLIVIIVLVIFAQCAGGMFASRDKCSRSRCRPEKDGGGDRDEEEHEEDYKDDGDNEHVHEESSI